MNDQRLWDELRRSNKSALKKIYDTHVEDLIQYGYRFCKAQELVEDCVHDLFIYLWQHREKLGKTDSIKRYLLVALRRSIIRQLKKESTIEGDQAIPFDASLSIEEIWIDEEENTERQLALREAFEKLSARQKEVLYLRFYQDMPYESICEVMDINYQSVRNLIYASVQVMRKIMVSLISLLFLV
jgi:RNA polymerase sigma-70 factor (ECF subfamily)